MQQNYNSIFPELSGNSKVWIYTLERPLDKTEESFTRDSLNQFISSWAAHGKGLLGKADVIEQRFIIIAVDESNTIASGCSIDEQVRFLKLLSSELEVDFFNRTIFYTVEKEAIINSDLIDLFKNPEALFFDTMFTNLKDLRAGFLKEVKDSVLFAMAKP
jgi:hypothetical protein